MSFKRTSFPGGTEEVTPLKLGGVTSPGKTAGLLGYPAHSLHSVNFKARGQKLIGDTKRLIVNAAIDGRSSEMEVNFTFEEE